jgi:D-3-phosphoglycerate dehydrogenase / 2-oxoglutarate reductase
MKITILDDYLDVVRTLPCYAKIAGRYVTIWNDAARDLDDLVDRLRDTEALVLIRERTVISRALIERLTKLKIITLNGPYPHIDIGACTKLGIIVCSAHARISHATAELTWGLMIAAMRRVPQEMARLKGGRWQGSVGTGLHGRTLGIYGYGRIGKLVAGYATAFGMRVIVWSRERGLAQARADGRETAPGVEALFAQADIVTLHMRLTAQTRRAITAAHLAMMKPGAGLVNTSRAALIEEGALVKALTAGRPAFAALDVYDEEPLLDVNHPLLNMENVVCTPHLGYVERDQLNRYFDDQFERVFAYERGHPVDVVNPAALKGERRG